ncbi:uncharacterized protein LOC130701070 [Daphnia carinata]|uniref:uncharacterized protein LOC130701070 n=1 Tax=Daphnia carinata TaxID=120202 RepID=UPI00257AF029|nr:uncharacterized protein LOC130701070 [Daphnia carinata]
MKICAVLMVTVIAYMTQGAPLPHQHGNDPFNSISRTFNEMATNTFASAAAQQGAHQQGMWPAGGRPVSASASAGAGREFSSAHNSGSMWQHASASASGPVAASASASVHSSSTSIHQQKSRQGRPANRSGRPSRNRNSSRNANHI